jgi:DNA invertase Pin-like site-specific DNA recombinase
MIAIGYIRVSTDHQASEGVSLEGQRKQIAGWCELHGWNLQAIYSDEGLSGRSLRKRVGLDAALSAVCNARGVLVVYSLSRLARSTKDCIRIADRLELGQANLVSVTERLDTTTGIGRFFFRLMASLAELESDQVSERVRFAHRQCLESGRLRSRWVPFGWEVVQGTKSLRVNPAEQAVLDRMEGWRNAGESFASIASRLNALGIPAKRGGAWWAETVKGALGNRRLRQRAG